MTYHTLDHETKFDFVFHSILYSASIVAKCVIDRDSRRRPRVNGDRNIRARSSSDCDIWLFPIVSASYYLHCICNDRDPQFRRNFVLERVNSSHTYNYFCNNTSSQFLLIGTNTRYFLTLSHDPRVRSSRAFSSNCAIKIRTADGRDDTRSIVLRDARLYPARRVANTRTRNIRETPARVRILRFTSRRWRNFARITTLRIAVLQPPGFANSRDVHTRVRRKNFDSESFVSSNPPAYPYLSVSLSLSRLVSF